MKQIVSLRRMSNDQLKGRLNEIGNSLRRERASLYGAVQPTSHQNDTMFVKRLRKERARILTILHERKGRTNQNES